MVVVDQMVLLPDNILEAQIFGLALALQEQMYQFLILLFILQDAMVVVQEQDQLLYLEV